MTTHIEQELNHADPIVRRNVFRAASLRTNPNPSLVEQAITDPAYFIRLDTIRTVILSPDQHFRALHDIHPQVRAQAVRHASGSGEGHSGA